MKIKAKDEQKWIEAGLFSLSLLQSTFFSDKLRLNARPGVWFRESFSRHYKYVSGFRVDMLVSENSGLS